MPEAIQYDVSDATQVPDESSTGNHEELFRGQGERFLAINRHRLEGYAVLGSVDESWRGLILIEGQGAWVQQGQDAPSAYLRPLEPYDTDGVWDTRVEGQALLLEVLLGDDQGKPVVTALHLGQRVLRESLVGKSAFVYAHKGGLVARITDEEDPFQLAPGESLWLDELESGMELELRGQDAESVLFLLQLPG